MIRHLAISSAAVLLIVTVGGAQPLPGPGLARVVGSTMFTLKLPVDSCTVPNLTLGLATHLEVPAGVEYLPGECVRRAPFSEEIPLVGRTLHDVLDLLVESDPRFYWTESNGVVVMRPLAAWSNKDHFLHATLAGLDLKDVNIGAAMDAIFPSRFGHQGLGEQLMATDPSKITLSTGPLSVVEALDAVARAHGRMRWHVQYCTRDMKAEGATVWMHTYDDRGIGRPMPRARDAQGRVVDPCVKQ